MKVAHKGPKAIMPGTCHLCNLPVYLVGMAAYLAYREAHPAYCVEHRQIRCNECPA